MRTRYDGRAIRGLLRPLSYLPVEQLFYQDDLTLGFGFLCQALEGVEDGHEQSLKALLALAWPENAAVQFGSFGFGSPNGVEVEEADAPLLITAKIPVSEPCPTADDIKKASLLREAAQKVLEQMGLKPADLNNHDLVRLTRAQLHAPFCTPERLTGWSSADEGSLLRNQMVDEKALFVVDPRGLTCGEERVRVLCVRNYPALTSFGAALDFGSDRHGKRGVSCPHLLSGTVTFTAGAKEPRAAQAGRAGPLVRLGTDDGPKRLNRGREVPRMVTVNGVLRPSQPDVSGDDRQCRYLLTLTLFPGTQDTADAAVVDAQTYWGGIGFDLLPDTAFALPLFLNALPLGSDPEVFEEIDRHKVTTTDGVLPYLPVFRRRHSPALPDRVDGLVREVA